MKNFKCMSGVWYYLTSSSEVFISMFFLIEMKITHFITVEQKSSIAAWQRGEML